MSTQGVSCALLLTALSACGAESEAQPTERPPLSAFTEVSASSFAQVLEQRAEPVLLVNLWSTWCRPCMEEMPALVRLAERHRVRGVGAVFISMDVAASRDEALRFMQNVNAPSPSYLRTERDADFIRAVHGEWSGTLPATLVLGRDRRPLGFWTGEAPLSDLDELLAQSTAATR